MIKAVIFDYDGVIVNSDPFNEQALKYGFEQKGIPFTHVQYVTYFAGKRLRDGLTHFLHPLGKVGEIDEFIALKKSQDPRYGEEVTTFADAMQFIAKIKDKYKLALASGARRSQIEIALKKYNLQETFNPVITGEDYANGKPDPEVYLLTLAKLGLPKNEVVVIEDATSGVSAAKKAGLTCVAVTHTHSPESLHDADLVVDSLEQVDLAQFNQPSNAV